MLSITDKRVISFYKKHKNLDVNAMNSIFIDIIQKLMDNISDQIDSGQNILLIKELLNKVNIMENKMSTTQNSLQNIESNLETISNKLHSDISGLISTHLNSLINNIRDTIKSNNSDSEKNIMELISEKNELFLNKINSLTDNSKICNFFSDETKKINQSINQELSKLFSSIEKNDSQAIISNFKDLLSSKYQEIDNSFKARFDSLISSSSSSSNSMYSEIISKLERSSKTLVSVDDYFQKQTGSNSKGKQGEGKLEFILNDLFPNASIINTSGKTAAGDFLIERNGNPTILIDTKDYETVVPVKEVEKMIRDIEKNNCNGILISQHSGIAQKNNFEINVHNNYIIVFIHCCNYDPSRIIAAANIIDHLAPIVTKNIDNNEESISSDLLLRINREYQELVRHKLNMIDKHKKYTQEFISEIQKIDLPTLTNFLETKYANTGKTGFKCTICGFIGKNAKSLSVHKRNCNKNNIVIDTEITLTPP